MHTWGGVKCILDQTLKGQHGSEGQRVPGGTVRERGGIGCFITIRAGWGVQT